MKTLLIIKKKFKICKKGKKYFNKLFKMLKNKNNMLKKVFL